MHYCGKKNKRAGISTGWKRLKSIFSAPSANTREKHNRKPKNSTRPIRIVAHMHTHNTPLHRSYFQFLQLSQSWMNLASAYKSKRRLNRKERRLSPPFTALLPKIPFSSLHFLLFCCCGIQGHQLLSCIPSASIWRSHIFCATLLTLLLHLWPSQAWIPKAWPWYYVKQYITNISELFLFWIGWVWLS